MVEAGLSRRAMMAAGQLSIMAAAWSGSSADALNTKGPSAGFAAQLADVRAGRLTGVFNGSTSGWLRPPRATA